MNVQKLRDAIDAARFGIFDDIEEVITAAERVCELERLDQVQACINIWHSGLGVKPWMFEIRRAGVLYGSFMDVDNRYDCRADAEAEAIKICETMINGTFQETYTYLRTKCPRCRAQTNEIGECLVCDP